MMHFNPHKTFSGPPGGRPRRPDRRIEALGPVPARAARPTRRRPLLAHCQRPGRSGRIVFARERSGAHGCCLLTAEGLHVVENAVLNAHYLLSRVSTSSACHATSLHARVRSVGSPTQSRAEHRAMDIAKRLLDYGFHAPFISPSSCNADDPAHGDEQGHVGRLCRALFPSPRNRDLLHEASQHADQPADEVQTALPPLRDKRTEEEGGRRKDKRQTIRPSAFLPLPRPFPFPSAFFDPPASWNMAVDEVLGAGRRPRSALLALYRWQEPTLSLGYFQAYEPAASRAERELPDRAPAEWRRRDRPRSGIDLQPGHSRLASAGRASLAALSGGPYGPYRSAGRTGSHGVALRPFRAIAASRTAVSVFPAAGSR